VNDNKVKHDDGAVLLRTIIYFGLQTPLLYALVRLALGEAERCFYVYVQVLGSMFHVILYIFLFKNAFFR
jgi:hypothetical protein